VPYTCDPCVQYLGLTKANCCNKSSVSPTVSGWNSAFRMAFRIDANSAVLSQDDLPVLDELYYFLIQNPSVNVELGGHTNNRCDTEYCNSLSEKRAKTIADYLIKKGIDAKRLQYKGYGKTNPIATNSTPEGRKTNQRVEVKILSQ